MSNVQLYLAIGLPSIIGLSNLAFLAFIFSRTDARFTRMESRFDHIDADLRQFFSITGAHTEAIDTLKKR